MWEESGIFYRIAPAWISSSDYGIGDSKETNHEGWIAPKFLWKYLVERKYGDKYDIDLKDPRKENGYFEALESDREFQMDVAAAVAGTYMWSMFTQKEKDMQTESQQNPRRCTWIDWMNDHGIGVNMESMAGDPRQFFKLWRPVHAVAACRAVNITARRKAREEGLGERGDLHPKLDDCPVKFTIDMEHVSSFGVNPLKEMEILKEKEKDLLENPVSIDGTTVQTPGDSEKPLAKMVRMYHLTKPGHETTSGVGHTHGPFRKGNTELYRWLYKLVEWGFGRTGEDGERASVMYEVGGEKAGTVYQAKLSMDMIQIGIDPEKDLDPSQVDPTKDQFDSREEALLARFFSMDKSQYSSEWAKIEEHAFDPLQGLLEAEEFDYTYSSKASLENDNQPRDWIGEEYK